MKEIARFAYWILLGATLLAACSGRRTGGEAHETFIWYVETTGDDRNVCWDAAEPCRTLGEALSRADADDKIIIGEGTFTEVGTDGSSSYSGPFSINAASLWITGAGRGRTFIDFGGVGGMYIWGPGDYRLENFTLQNGGPIVACLTISDRRDPDLDLPTINTATIENVEATNCATGISIYGTGERLLNQVIASGNRGNGLFVNGANDVIVQASEFNDNARYGIDSGGSNLSICCSTVIDGNGGALTPDGVAYGSGVNVNYGTVTITQTSITNNGAGPDSSIDPAVRAGGYSHVSISDSVIDGNRSGPGAFNDSVLLIEDTTISNSSYAGVFLSLGGEAHLYNVTIVNNCSRPDPGYGCWGGGIENYGDGILEVRNSRITGNLNGWAAGISNRGGGSMSISQTTIEGNSSTASCIVESNGDSVIENSLIANNTQQAGNPPTRAICIFDGLMSISNSTISHNTGDGIEVLGGELSLSFVTITGNDEVGLSVTAIASVRRIENALIAGNRLDCVGSAGFASALRGTNIDTDGSCPDSFLSYASSELALDELADNGGPTYTHALLPSSPAINAATGTCLEVDQRFVARPVGGACDVGAYEAGAFATSLEVTPTTDSEITVTIIQDARCRIGPDFIYPDYDFFEPGQTTTVHGRSADSNWYYVQALSFSGKCFIGKAVLQFDVDPEILLALPVIQAPPTPTPTLDPDESLDITPTPTPEPKPTACPTLINKPGSCN